MALPARGHIDGVPTGDCATLTGMARIGWLACGTSVVPDCDQAWSNTSDSELVVREVGPTTGAGELEVRPSRLLIFDLFFDLLLISVAAAIDVIGMAAACVLERVDRLEDIADVIYYPRSASKCYGSSRYLLSIIRC